MKDTGTMKIAVLSPSAKHLQDAAAALASEGHEVVRVEGGKSQLRAIAERERPDLLIADGMCCDLEELGQVEQVTLSHPDTAVVLMCSSQTPEYLVQAMRAGVREVLPSPVAPEALRAAVGRFQAKMRGAAPARAADVLAFLPCKGGSGATFLATNLAWELGRDRKVLLVDFNLQFGDALSFVYDRRPPATVADVAAGVDRLDASLLASSTVKVTPGFSVLAASDDPGRALDVQPAHVDAIVSLATRHYDFVVLDLARVLNPANIRALDLATRVFPVLMPTLPSIRHAVKLREVFASLGYAPQKTQFVVNACERGADIGPDHVQRSLGGQPVASIADGGREVVASINRGEPLVSTSRSHPVARQIIDMAHRFDPQPEEHKGLLGRIFRRA